MYSALVSLCDRRVRGFQGNRSISLLTHRRAGTGNGWGGKSVVTVALGLGLGLGLGFLPLIVREHVTDCPRYPIPYLGAYLPR